MPDELTPEELEAQEAAQLPDREAMSTLPTDLPGSEALLGTGLLDLDVNVDLSADAAAPVGAAVAANANVAAPIDAAVAANVASPNGVAAASAPQTSVIGQELNGVANAETNQTSNIDQGGTDPRLVAALAVLVCAAPTGVAQARPAHDNTATATIEQDGGRAFDFEWSLERQRAGVVEHKNTAQAGARCSDCRATAIAFQIVIVEGQPEKLAPVNQAVAVNDQCTRCVVYAGARQLVRVVDKPVRFTARGALTLVDVRRDLKALENQDLTVDQLVAALEAQEARALNVLQNELVPRSGKSWKVLRKHDRGDDDS